MAKKIIIALIVVLTVGLIFTNWHGGGNSTPNPCESSAKAKSCTQDNGAASTNPDLSVTGIFVGYSSHLGLDKLLRDLVGILKAKKESVKINVLFSRDDERQATEAELSTFRTSPDKNWFNFIEVSDQEALWAQDFMVNTFDFDKRQQRILDLPYRENEGEHAPEDIARACRYPVEVFDGDNEHASLAYGNSNYGGNLESLSSKTFIRGDGMAQQSLNFFEKEFGGRAIHIPSEWLRTAHIDEMVHIVPNLKAGPDECKTAIAYASPLLALQILARSKKYELPLAQDLRFQQFANCLKPSKRKNESCESLRDANTAYARLVSDAVEQLSGVIKDEGACKQVATVELPIVFFPDLRVPEYGSVHDGAQPAHPNPVNGIMLNHTYIFADLKQQEMNDAVVEAFGKLGIGTAMLQADMLFRAGGGLHCWTQTIARCE